MNDTLNLCLQVLVTKKGQARVSRTLINMMYFNVNPAVRILWWKKKQKQQQKQKQQEQ